MPASRSGSPSRQAPRYRAHGVALRSPSLRAELVNLSLGGAAIQATGQAPRIGSEVLCELESAHTVAAVKGHVRWCRLGGTTQNGDGEIVPVYQAGIGFTNGAPGNLLRILRAMSLVRRPAAD